MVHFEFNFLLLGSVLIPVARSQRRNGCVVRRFSDGGGVLFRCGSSGEKSTSPQDFPPAPTSFEGSQLSELDDAGMSEHSSFLKQSFFLFL